jgi:hypothetical protein
VKEGYFSFAIKSMEHRASSYKSTITVSAKDRAIRSRLAESKELRDKRMSTKRRYLMEEEGEEGLGTIEQVMAGIQLLTDPAGNKVEGARCIRRLIGVDTPVEIVQVGSHKAIKIT